MLKRTNDLDGADKRIFSHRPRSCAGVALLTYDLDLESLLSLDTGHYSDRDVAPLQCDALLDMRLQKARDGKAQRALHDIVVRAQNLDQGFLHGNTALVAHLLDDAHLAPAGENRRAHHARGKA